MLIVMAGLPGAGKSTIAREVAQILGWTLVSVDPIETAMWRAGIDREQPTGLAAYAVAGLMLRRCVRDANPVVACEPRR